MLAREVPLEKPDQSSGSCGVSGGIRCSFRISATISSGEERNPPIGPHSQVQKASASSTASALSDSLRPMMVGVMKWPSTRPTLAALVDELDLPLADSAVDRVLLVHALDVGPMASTVWRAKVRKMADEEHGVQAAITNVLENNRVVTEAARRAGLASPLMDVCHALYRETLELGHGVQDMSAVVRAVDARTARLKGASAAG